MKRISLVFSIGAVVAGVAAFVSAPAHADEVNNLTCLTFSEPVELPSVALPAGSYLFKHPDGANDRHIVQVMTSDGKKVIGTFLTIPQERLAPSDKTVVTFAEMPVGTPEAVRAWFYPNEKVGDEFVYPKDEAMKIARATHQSVLSTSSSISNQTEMQKASVVRVTATGGTEDNPTTVGTSGLRSLKMMKKANSSALAPCTGR
jgi:hypothetical protein